MVHAVTECVLVPHKRSPILRPDPRWDIQDEMTSGLKSTRVTDSFRKTTHFGSKEPKCCFGWVQKVMGRRWPVIYGCRSEHVVVERPKSGELFPGRRISNPVVGHN